MTTPTPEVIEAVANENAKPVHERQCPLCGYTKADQDLYMDHRICEARGGINFRSAEYIRQTGEGSN